MDSNFFNEAALGGLVITATLLLAGHWFPWSQLIGRKLPRLGAYVYGVVCLWLGFFIWRYAGHGDIESPLALAVVSAVGGFFVALAYGIDLVGRWLDTTRRKNRHERE